MKVDNTIFIDEKHLLWHDVNEKRRDHRTEYGVLSLLELDTVVFHGNVIFIVSVVEDMRNITQRYLDIVRYDVLFDGQRYATVSCNNDMIRGLELVFITPAPVSLGLFVVKFLVEHVERCFS